MSNQPPGVVSILLEMDATEFLGDRDSPDFNFCVEVAVMQYVGETESEFLFMVGAGPNDNLADIPPPWPGVLEAMKDWGCDPEFIGLYEYAAYLGVSRVLFHSSL